MTIIGLMGFIGSGKGTVGEILVNDYGFQKIAFADALKDAVSEIFQWPRDMLEGNTIESREWREKIDSWWSQRFGYEVTPRLILQQMGTDSLRSNISDNLWISALERRLKRDTNYVITDVRFENEIQFINKINGTLIWVKRGSTPTKEELKNLHKSETEWYNSMPYYLNYIIENNGTIDELKTNVSKVLTTIPNYNMIFHHPV